MKSNEYKKTKRRVITRRGVLWLGQTCNLRCQFCYFLDRISNKEHPEHDFMSLEKAKKICSTLVDFYHNNSIDIQGGEPTIYRDIYELVEYCRKIGLLPTLITNALVLSQRDNCQRLKDAGIRDLLLSIHGLEETYDTLVGVKGAYHKQMKALENLMGTGIPFRYNCVLTKPVLPQLSRISQLAVETNTRVVNFIAFNQFSDQSKADRRSDKNVPRYSEVSPYLTEAINILTNKGIECNVRYFPICMIDAGHRKSIYNFQQLTYDIHEWDYASLSWTERKEQLQKQGDISPVVTIEEANRHKMSVLNSQSPPTALKHFKNSVKYALSGVPKVRDIAGMIYKKIDRHIHKTYNHINKLDNIEGLYRENAKTRSAHSMVYTPKCYHCNVQPICDGFHGDYASIFGTDEANPILDGEKIFDPKYFISEQEKIVEIEDYKWAL